MSKGNASGRGGGAGKGPAPVLPAMGLHSFHDDSPPFSGATDLPDPDPLSLDSTRPHHLLHSTRGHSSIPHGTPSPLPPSHMGIVGSYGRSIDHDSSPTEVDEDQIYKTLLHPSHNNNDHSRGSPGMSSDAVDQAGTGETILSSEQRSTNTAAPGLPQTAYANRSPTGSTTTLQPRPVGAETLASEDDVSLSSIRSRRLLSGYLFGNPPSPDQQISSLTEHERGLSDDAAGANAVTVSEVEERVQGDETRHTLSHRSSAEMSLSEYDDHIRTGASSLLHSPVQSQDITGQNDNHNGDNDAVDEKSYVRQRNMSFEHDLNGTRDGEADADDKATMAVGRGSAAYMQKEEGEDGQYQFPMHRLKRRMKDESKIPLVIVACGSFSPPTYLHLRMFEMAKDELIESQTYEIMAGYYSPVSSYYKKAGLAPAHHRVRMCELAVEHTSTWLMVDPWEAGQPEYQRTAVVLDHFDEMLNGKNREHGVEMADGSRRKYKIMLLAGGDLIESFGEPGVWSEPDLHIILGRYGCLIVERAGSDVWAFLLSHDVLYYHRRNVIVIKQLIYNDISSTKVRLFVRRGMSIKYLLPNSVIQYIQQNRLYLNPDKASLTN